MDTHLPLGRSYCSIEVLVSRQSHDDLESQIGPNHPYRSEIKDTLFYYDQPIITIDYISGDDRPRLNILVDERSSSNDVNDSNRVFTSIFHHLIFDNIESLHATLHEGHVPTIESYQMAEHIIRYKTISSTSENPDQLHYLITAEVALEDLDSNELPYDNQRPQGLATPTNKMEKHS